MGGGGFFFVERWWIQESYNANSFNINAAQLSIKTTQYTGQANVSFPLNYFPQTLLVLGGFNH